MIDSLIEQHLKGFSAKNILDVGPGYGNFSRIAARVTGATDITYVDCELSILSWQAEECKKLSLASTGLFIYLNEDDLSKLEGTYDLILCQEVLEHLHNAEDVLAAVANRLSENGRILITVPTKRSEQWLKWLNPSYMKDEPFGHVREFDKTALMDMLKNAQLSPIVFIPAQPHFFISHSWFFGTRMKIDGSTGKILTGGLRGFIGKYLHLVTRWFFMLTGMERWGRIIPRNYFVIAERSYHAHTS